MTPRATFTALLALSALLFSAGSVAAQRPSKHLDDVRALLDELDRGYPFFELKGIEKDWAATKKELLRRGARCEDESELVLIAVSALEALRDGHASLTEVRPKFPDRAPRFVAGLALAPATKGRVVVIGADRALAPRLPVGTVVTKIEGKKARDWIEARGAESWKKGGFFSSPQRAEFFAYRLPFVGERGAEFALEYLDGRRKKKLKIRCEHEAGGWQHNYNLPEDLVREGKSLWHGLLEGGVGYLYLRRIDSGIAAGLRAALAARGDATRWIVDLRGNTGGGYDRELLEATEKLGKRVAVILDAGAISAAETYARDLVRINEARIFGARSAGSSSSKKTFTLPSGAATVRYSTRGRTGLDGKIIEFHGIAPHEALEADPTQLARGLNTEIEAARAWLSSEDR